MISVIIPCYNEREVLELTYGALVEAARRWQDTVEILLVDDGSQDNTWEIIESLARRDSRVRGVRLSRNFGHAAALGAGLERMRGDVAVVLDADLQDPPSVVDEMLDKWRAGYDVVYGQRNARHGETWFKLVTAKAFYALLDRLNGLSIPRNSSDFSLMDARVVRQLVSFREHGLFWRGLRSWAGFKQTAVHFDRPARAAGETKYTLSRMIKLASNGLLGFSEFPLRLPLYAGGAALAICAVALVWSIAAGIGLLPAAWMISATALSLGFLGAVQLVCLGIVGEYLNRIYDEVRGRPRWIVDTTVGAAEENAMAQPTSRRKAG
jgi:dolichol-phosphate mannosyltransferase